MFLNTEYAKKIFSFSCLIIFIIYWGCADSGTDPQDEKIVLPDSNITYTDHIYPLFLLKCGSRDGCHSNINPERDLILTEYSIVKNHALLYDGTKLVLEGNGENSPLYLVLLPGNNLGISRMPKNGPYLNANQYNGVKIWIDEGAN